MQAQPQIAPYLGSGEGKMEITKDYWRESQDLDENEKSKPFAIVIGFVRPPLEVSPGYV